MSRISNLLAHLESAKRGDRNGKIVISNTKVESGRFTIRCESLDDFSLLSMKTESFDDLVLGSMGDFHAHNLKSENKVSEVPCSIEQYINCLNKVEMENGYHKRYSLVCKEESSKLESDASDSKPTMALRKCIQWLSDKLGYADLQTTINEQRVFDNYGDLQDGYSIKLSVPVNSVMRSFVVAEIRTNSDGDAIGSVVSGMPNINTAWWNRCIKPLRVMPMLKLMSGDMMKKVNSARKARGEY